MNCLCLIQLTVQLYCSYKLHSERDCTLFLRTCGTFFNSPFMTPKKINCQFPRSKIIQAMFTEMIQKKISQTPCLEIKTLLNKSWLKVRIDHRRCFWGPSYLLSTLVQFQPQQCGQHPEHPEDTNSSGARCSGHSPSQPRSTRLVHKRSCRLSRPQHQRESRAGHPKSERPVYWALATHNTGTSILELTSFVRKDQNPNIPHYATDTGDDTGNSASSWVTKAAGSVCTGSPPTLLQKERLTSSSAK